MSKNKFFIKGFLNKGVVNSYSFAIALKISTRKVNELNIEMIFK